MPELKALTFDCWIIQYIVQVIVNADYGKVAITGQNNEGDIVNDLGDINNHLKAEQQLSVEYDVKHVLHEMRGVD